MSYYDNFKTYQGYLNSYSQRLSVFITQNPGYTELNFINREILICENAIGYYHRKAPQSNDHGAFINSNDQITFFAVDAIEKHLNEKREIIKNDSSWNSLTKSLTLIHDAITEPFNRAEREAALRQESNTDSSGNPVVIKPSYFEYPSKPSTLKDVFKKPSDLEFLRSQLLFTNYRGVPFITMNTEGYLLNLSTGRYKFLVALKDICRDNKWLNTDDPKSLATAFYNEFRIDFQLKQFENNYTVNNNIDKYLDMLKFLKSS